MIGYKHIMEAVGTFIDAVGVVIIVTGAIIATGRFLLQSPRSYTIYRQNVGRSILLGLEFLIGGDIIRTVVVAPTPINIAVLAGIVLIRTFLSMALQLELEGRWPWQASQSTQNTDDGSLSS